MGDVTPIKGAKDAIDAAITKAEQRKEKGETSASKNSAQKQAEIEKHLDNATQRAEKIGTRAKDAAETVRAVIKLQAEFNNETGSARDPLKESALTNGVMTLEAINEAEKALKSARSDVLTRLNSTFDYARKDVNQVVKERQFPKAQFELELNLNRSNIDAMHRVVEKNGAERRETEATNNGKTKKAA